MKKILLATAIGLVIFSCKNEESPASSTSYEASTTLGKEGKDASYAFGVSLGQAAESFNKNPQLKDSLNVDVLENAIRAYLKNPGEQDSYAQGLKTGQQIAGAMDNEILKGKLDKDEIIAGIMAYLRKEDLRISKDSTRNVMDNYYKSIQKEESETNKKKGLAFMNNIKKEEGVQTTESGLAYKVLQQGNGEKPSEGDILKVKYTGKTVDGEVFDSTDKNNGGEAIDMPLRANGLIQGWVEGMKMMSKGSKYTFYVPADLGYGERGSGKIKPGETLIFDIELIDFEKGKASTQPGPQPGVNINPVPAK